MDQLLSIKNVPIKVEVKVQRGEFRRVEDSVPKNTPSVQVSAKKGGGICLTAEPYQIDLSEYRNYDTYIPSSGYDDGITLTYEAVAKLADNGGTSAGTGTGGASASDESSRQLSARRASRSIESVLQSLPKNKRSAVSYSDGTLSINYQVSDSEMADFSMDSPEFEFIPGSIEFIVTQMPKVDIEYLGDPIYFPRSADPNYEPIVDVHA